MLARSGQNGMPSRSIMGPYVESIRWWSDCRSRPRGRRITNDGMSWCMPTLDLLHKRDRQDVLLESGALLEAVVPAREMVEPAPVRHQAPVAIGDQADRDVAHRERVAGDECGVAELRIENLHRGRGLLARLLDVGCIALFRRCADHTPEQPVD